jgi:purine-binding chemotaxis protein CheW
LGSIFYVPGSPDFILGVINIRGDIESVIAINKFLGLSEPGVTQSSRIAIASTEEMRSGVLVDSIEDVVDIPVSALKLPIATLDQSQKEFVAGEFTYNEKNITLLDIGKIFGRIA